MQQFQKSQWFATTDVLFPLQRSVSWLPCPRRRLGVKSKYTPASALTKVWSFKTSHYPGQVLLTLPDRNAGGGQSHKQHLKPFRGDRVCFDFTFYWELAKAIWPCVTGETAWGNFGRMGRDGRYEKEPTQCMAHPLLDFFLHVYLSIMCIYISDQSIAFFSGPHHTTCRILAPQSGSNPSLSSGACSPLPLDCQESPKIWSSKRQNI